MIQAASAQLDFWSLLFDPFLTVEEAQFLLDDCARNHVINLTEEGELVGVDISSRRAGDQIRCIRVYAFSVQAFVHRRAGRKLPRRPLEIPVEQVMPHSRPYLLRREVARLLKCTPEHVANLNFPGPKYASHLVNRMPRIDREAFIAWLGQREIK